MVLALAATLVALELGRTGIADFLRLEPCAYIDFVQSTARRPDPALLGRARDRLELARSVDPDNPVIHEYLAVVYVHRAKLVANDLPLHMAYLERADGDYVEALTLRPNSAYVWAGLAVVRGALLVARTRRGDGAPGLAQQRLALQYAMRRAMALAAYEPAVLTSMTSLGNSLRDVLDDDVLRGVEEMDRRLRKATAAALDRL
jgi:hypothetical protein